MRVVAGTPNVKPGHFENQINNDAGFFNRFFENEKKRGPHFIQCSCQSEKTDPAVDAAGLFETVNQEVQMLHTPQYDAGARAYCGPTAISAVAGVPISKVYKMVRRLRGEQERGLRKSYGHPPKLVKGGRVLDVLGRKIPIRGLSNMELLAVMQRLGFKSQPHKEWGMTLKVFCEDRGHMGPYIVNVTGHYVAVSHGMICDTHTKMPVPCEQYPKLGRRVKRFWKFQ